MPPFPGAPASGPSVLSVLMGVKSLQVNSPVNARPTDRCCPVERCSRQHLCAAFAPPRSGMFLQPRDAGHGLLEVIPRS